MMYVDDAGIVFFSAEGLAKMMAPIETVFEAAGLTVSEGKTEAMLLQTPDQTTLAPQLVIEAAGQRYKQTARFLYLGGVIHENGDLSLEKSTDGSVSCEHASNGSARSCMIGRPPPLALKSEC